MNSISQRRRGGFRTHTELPAALPPVSWRLLQQQLPWMMSRTPFSQLYNSHRKHLALKQQRATQ